MSACGLVSSLPQQSSLPVLKTAAIPDDISCPFGTVKREHGNKYPSSEGSYGTLIHKLVEPHIASFNAITDQSLLENGVKNLEMRVIYDASKTHYLKMWIEDVQLGKPMLPEKETFSLDRGLYPSECRQRGITYEAKLMAKICFQMDDDGPIHFYTRHLGDFPIMVRSNRCHLEGLSPVDLIARHEESEEMGGYFIVNGIERLIRLLVVTRRNYPLAVVRSSFLKKGPSYTHFGVLIRCVRDDTTSQTITLHYLSDVGITVRFSHLKQEYLVPVLLILRALAPLSDKQIFEGVVQGDFDDTTLVGQMEALLRAHRTTNLYSQDSCLQYLGARFQAVFRYDDRLSEREIGELVIRRMLFVHLEDGREKVSLLLLMIRKLLALVGNKIIPDNPDSLMNHEILLPGHLLASYLKEKLDELLGSARTVLLQDQQRGASWSSDAFSPESPTSATDKFCRRLFSKLNLDIGKKIRYFLGTGNMPSSGGMDLQQVTGYTVVAERLNYLRYLSHFRSVHRGSFFATLKTTTVRKLLPESWGFLCPVHTPDGAPCGLLNHLTHTCSIVSGDGEENNPTDRVRAIASVLVGLGVTQLEAGAAFLPKSYGAHCVLLDGCLIGYASFSQLTTMVSQLRQMKGNGIVPAHMEIVLILQAPKKGLFPGLFLFTTPSRLMRPVYRIEGADLKKKEAHKLELIGTFEQVFLNIALQGEEYGSGDPSTGLPATLAAAVLPTHVEGVPTNILSVVANLTPFCDFNQSPRNMYQCQMAKQSMGTPLHAFPFRSDSKLYRLQSGQSPVVRPSLFNTYQMDSHPNGANAVVAVISYTGYDMEDAMIINKSSFERGFGNGSIYKSELIDLKDHISADDDGSSLRIFACTDMDLINGGLLDHDGFPPVGRLLRPGDPFCSTALLAHSTSEDPNSEMGISDENVIRWKAAGLEEAYVESVRLMGDAAGLGPARRALIVLRIPRPPVIGDKFSSRHGQKGVCSQKWPLIDMPFSEHGLTPDIIINPHAFPSRMTIGMFVESMAGKAGCLHGTSQDATPFRLTGVAVECFGDALKKAGFSYYGNEPMYSGVFGNELAADIFIGVVYYQRLRHMVSDKFQVRTTGPVHNLTRQPIKGRKRAGGIRFGEMERDSLLAHGTAFLLHDRLMNCSDYTQMHACVKCGDILSILAPSRKSHGHEFNLKCTGCGASGASNIVVVALPYVYRYLVSELMVMNVRLKMDLTSAC
ncbi:hypothetical protein MDAP_000048 [Mitosporidium daphniae]